LDVIAVGKIASMLARAVENTPTLMPVAAAAGATRFARDPSEYANHATSPGAVTAAARSAQAGTALASVGTGGVASQGTSVANAGTTLA
ncbi:IS21 family transposase, partial [Arthrobacter sp. LAPM80]